MRRSVTAALKYYNMNSSGKRVGDCYKRALALAFRKDYDQVKNELNKMVRNGEAYQNNAYTTLDKYIRRNGGVGLVDGTYDASSVEKFCEEHPTGTYLLFTNKDPKALFSNHVVAIIDGDAYDSWNSYQSRIHSAFSIDAAPRQLHYDDVKDMTPVVAENIYPLLEDYITKLNMKYVADDSIITQFSLKSIEAKSSDTISIWLRCFFDEARVPLNSKYYSRRWQGYDITLKLDINQNADENTKRLWPKLKQKVYDWAYNISSELKNAARLDTLGHRYYGDKEIFKAVPDELIPYVYSADKLGSYSEYNYEVTLKGLDQWGDDGRLIDFYADTIKEMRQKLVRYFETGYSDY